MSIIEPIKKNTNHTLRTIETLNQNLPAQTRSYVLMKRYPHGNVLQW